MTVVFERDLACTMRDGVVLRANVYRPGGDGPWPVLLSRLPYGKDIAAHHTVNPLLLAESGYIVVVQDVRGRFASEGTFVNLLQEFADGYDTIEWARTLPGANGTVGMYGSSYYAYTQWAAAASGHPALRAVVPAIALDQQRDTTYRGGALEWGLLASWSLLMSPVELTRVASQDPTFPMQFYSLVQDINALPSLYEQLPLAEFSPLKSRGLFADFFKSLEQAPTDPAWDAYSIAPHYEGMQVDTYLISGWYDVFQQQTLQSYERFAAAGKHARIVIGPWTHANWSGTAGDVDFGMGANAQFLDLQGDMTSLHKQWFDQTLKGLDTPLGAQPPVRYFTMGINRWQFATAWPLPETVYTEYYLGSDGKLSAAVADSGARADTFAYDPLAPVPTVGGNTLMVPRYPAGPWDQARIEARDDVLVYTSDVLQQPVEVTGQVIARLWVSSDAPDTDFVVRLTDVHPDGRSINLVDGILRMRYRDGLAPAPDLVEGMVYAIEVDCWATSHVFLPGHRMRVHVTSSSFPRWDRNLNTGASGVHSADTRVATQTVWHDAAHPSHICLPVIVRA